MSSDPVGVQNIMHPSCLFRSFAAHVVDSRPPGKCSSRCREILALDIFNRSLGDLRVTALALAVFSGKRGKRCAKHLQRFLGRGLHL